MARNRVIYQSEALFTSPNATGAHFVATHVITGGGQTGTAKNTPAKHSIMVGGHGLALRQDPYASIEYSTAANATASTVAAGVTKEVIDQGGEGNKYNQTGLFLGDLHNISGAVTGTSAFIGAQFAINDTAAAPGNNPSVSMFTNLADWNTFQSNHDLLNGGATNNAHVRTGVFLQPFSGTYKNLVQQLHRVQSANYSFTVNRTDVNVFGQLARIDAIALEPPTVNLDFSYYPVDGFNERNLGFYVQGQTGDLGKKGFNSYGEYEEALGINMGSGQQSAAKGHLQDDSAGKNFFILTTPEGTDAFNTTRPAEEKSIIGLGNGYLSDYTIEASIGSIPTASATVELFNAKSDKGITGVAIPSVKLTDGTATTGIAFTAGHSASERGDGGGAPATTGQALATALRPGDITMTIPQGLSIFADVNGDGSAHIQNFSLSLPLSRSPIDRLGTRFAFSRVVDFPVVATMSVSALISEVGTGNLAAIIDDCEERDVQIKMKAQSSCVAGSDKTDSLIIDFKGARIDSESISSDIGSNKSVDLTFTTQIGGPDDLAHGVFISGADRSVITGANPILDWGSTS